MNCEKCQELLSEFLDGTLGHREHAALSAHLAACPACALARQEFHAIISAARDSRDHLYSPPDERALWLRVRSTVESEGRRAATAPAREGLWSRLLHPHSPSPEVHQDLIDGQAVKPGRESRLASETTDLAVELDEDLLGEVFGLGRVGSHPQAERVDSSAVARVQLFEGRRVARG